MYCEFRRNTHIRSFFCWQIATQFKNGVFFKNFAFLNARYFWMLVIDTLNLAQNISLFATSMTQTEVKKYILIANVIVRS